MLLLAFDTATPAVAVASHDGQCVLAETSTVDARRPGELLAPSMAKVLPGYEPRDLTGIAVGVGPGPFTGPTPAARSCTGPGTRPRGSAGTARP